MPGPFSKVAPGEEVTFNAQAWNAMLGAAEAWKTAQSGGPPGASPQIRGGDIVRVKNQSGSNLLRTSILGLSGPIFPPSVSVVAFLQEVAFRAVTPTADHEGKFCVLLEPCRDGTLARAFVSGVCPVRIDVIDEGHTCAEVDPGNTFNLVSSEDGSAQILWREGDDDGGYSTGVQWAIIRFASTCGTTQDSTPARCECPEDEYEVEVECGECSAYYGGGTVMPKYWWLTITTAADTPYAYYDSCDDVACSQLSGMRIRLDHEGEGAYAYGDGCTWTGRGLHCVRVELTLAGDDWQITVMDRDDCVLAVLRKAASSFDCCGANGGWSLVEGSSCDLSVSLAPDPCTCCPDTTCPPEDEVLCHAFADCCIPVANCNILAVVAHNATVPCEPIPDCIPPGEDCGGINGNMTMTWAGDCTWRYKGTLSGGPTVVTAELALGDGGWTLDIAGDNGQTCHFASNGWDNCESVVALEYVGGTCPITSPAPAASIAIS